MKVSKILKRNQNLVNNHIVGGLQTNSKKVKENAIFYAIKGENFNGNDYIEEAIINGAKTIISEEDFPKKNKYKNINFIKVPNIRKTLAIHAKIYYKDISRDMTLIGVTGTNGKTTVTTLTYKYFQYLNRKATLIGTNGIYIMNTFYETKNTTPDILELYEILIESQKNGVDTVIMEVSSHAVKMFRIYGLHFKIALITNFTQDHLDFHKTMEDYKYTKGLFLNSIEVNDYVIINKDMEDFDFFYSLSNANIYTYGKKNCDYELIDYKLSITGSNFILKMRNELITVNTKLLGMFNIYNILAFIAIVDLLGIYSKKLIEFLNLKINILGRMEVISIENRYFVIDFAHTPDGVLNVLNFLNQVKKDKNIYVVIGCGGNRDKSKRKIIGSIATLNSYFTIFTNDNPRNEEPLDIIKDILEGVKTKNYLVILDRKMAIEEAYRRSLNGDIIAILGKGNEPYQIIGNSKIKYSDKEVVLGLQR